MPPVAGTAFVLKIGNGQHLLTLGGGLDSDTYTLTYMIAGIAYTTAAIRKDASAATIQSAIITALGALGTASVVVAGSARGPFTISYQGNLAGQDVPVPTGPTSSIGALGALVTVGTLTSAECCAFGAGLYVAAGASGGIWTSPDRSTWTQRTSHMTGSIFSVTFTNNLFIALSNTGEISTSVDGITWTARTATGIGGSGQLYGAGYGAGLWVIVGTDDTNGYLATSPDGITWTQRTSSFGTSLITSNVAFGAGLLAVGGASGKIATSPDGITWTQRTSSFGGSEVITAMIYAGGKFVAASNQTASIATSADGLTWTQVAVVPTTTPFEQIAYGGGYYVLVGSVTAGVAVVLFSIDGLTWTALDASVFAGAPDVRGVCYDGTSEFMLATLSAGKVSFAAITLGVTLTVNPTTYTLLGGQRNTTLSRSTSEADATTKDSAGWHEGAPIIRDWTTGAESFLLESDASYLALEHAWINRLRLLAEVATPGGHTYTGAGTLEAFPINAPHDNLVMLGAISVKGSGPLIKT